MSWCVFLARNWIFETPTTHSLMIQSMIQMHQCPVEKQKQMLPMMRMRFNFSGRPAKMNGNQDDEPGGQLLRRSIVSIWLRLVYFSVSNLWKFGLMLTHWSRSAKSLNIWSSWYWDALPSLGGQTISVCNQPLKSTQPGHTFIGRDSENQWMLGHKQACHEMH